MSESTLSNLQDYLQSRLGTRVKYARPWRCDELARLVIRHWPCRHLEDVAISGGRNHKDVRHAMALVVAQVHEQWEARHGIGPLWEIVLAGTVREICEILLGLWWGDERWRLTLCALAKQLGEREPLQ